MSTKPILVLQMQRMGDLILSFPLFLWLERVFPGSPLLVAAEKMFYEPLLNLSPKATYFPWDGEEMLLGNQFGTVLNLSIRERASRLAARANTERLLGPATTEEGVHRIHGPWQLYRASLVNNNRYNRFHWADLNALDCVPLSLMAQTQFSEPRIPRENRKVGLFLGASEAAKRPTPEFWATLCKDLMARDLRPVLFGGPAEVALGAEVERLYQGPVLNLCGKLGLDEFGAVGQTLSLFITPDTGPMHLAAWTGLRCLNLSMGNVQPWETGPYQPGHYVLRADMECARGCWACSRSRLHCHDPFDAGRIAVLVRRMVSGASDESLGRVRLPGLTLFRTGRNADGLYRLLRLDGAEPDAERLLGRYWQSFFGGAFGLWGMERAVRDWRVFYETDASAAKDMLAAIPAVGRQLAHGLRTGALLTADFWSSVPASLTPLTGYVQMLLENGDYSRQAWAEAMEFLEVFVGSSSS